MLQGTRTVTIIGVCVDPFPFSVSVPVEDISGLSCDVLGMLVPAEIPRM